MEKQESVSRQSSILKAPKQRQPLQCVAANPSSSENSPTIKLKRRVSFAKNKRIREFCNEAEQGTVWDDTYEEHDLSSTKNSSNDDPVIISVPCYDKENFPVQLFLKNDELNCKEVLQSAEMENENLSQCNIEMDETNIEDFNNRSDCENATIYCDDGMDMTNYIPSDIVPYQRHINSDINNVSDSKTCDKNMSIEISQNLPPILFQNLKNQLSDKNESASNSTDLTQSISTLLSSGLAKKSVNPINSKIPHAESSKSEIDCSNTVAMEFTSVLPSSTWINTSRCQNDDRTKNSIKTTKFSMAVPYTIQNDKNTENVDDYQETNITIQGKTKNLLQNSMEKTNVVSIFDQIRQIERNLESNAPLKEVIPSVNNIPKFDDKTQSLNNTISQEKTKIYQNNSMEMTEAVPILDQIHQSDVKEPLQPLNKTASQEKTKIFQNNSMEMTEAVPILDQIHRSDVNEPLKPLNKTASQEKTKIFQNNSMEMTETVPILDQIHQSDVKEPLQPLNKTASQEKTKIFQNNSMEMTEAVPIVNKVSELDVKEPSQQFTSTLLPEKTKIFQNNSMEMTEAVPVLNKLHKFDDKIHPLNNMTSQERTKIFQNNSMEMTEAVPILSKVRQLDAIEPSQLLSNNATLPEKTKIFQNNSMEITEAVPILSKVRQLDAIEPSQLLSNNATLPEKTKIFQNNSMEMTEAVPIINKACQLDVKEPLQQLNNASFPEKTKIFQNTSMEMTETVPILNNMNKLNDKTQPLNNMTSQEKSEIFQDNSMEMTEAVPILSKIRQLNAREPSQLLSNNTTLPEKTKIFQNNSMEITEAVPMINKVCQLDVKKPSQQLSNNATLPEKTKIFQNNSMEMTEAVPIINSISELDVKEPSQQLNNASLPEKTKIFQNTSMEMTEAVPVLNDINKLNAKTQRLNNMTSQEKTKIFQNNSMEMTEAVAMLYNAPKLDDNTQPLNNSSSREKTKFFLNCSMDVTEAVPGTQAGIASEKETKVSMNNSMEITELIPNQAVNSTLSLQTNNQNVNKTKIFADKSVEITETLAIRSKFVDPVKVVLGGAELEQIKTDINLSMEMPEENSVFSTIPSNIDLGKIPNNNNQQMQNKTRIFSNALVEVSEIIPTEQSIDGPSNYQEQIFSETEKEKGNIQTLKTIPSYNSSCEFVENANEIHKKSNKRCRQSDSEPTNECKRSSPNIPLLAKISQHEQNMDGTEVVFIKRSVDISESIPVKEIDRTKMNEFCIRNDITNEKTEVFHNMSMEITEAISARSTAYESNELLKLNFNGNKIESLLKKSMDTAENVAEKCLPLPSLQNNQLAPAFLGIRNNETQCNTQHSNIPDDIFPSTSLEFTSQISTVPNVIQAHTNACENNGYLNDATKVFHDATMEFTEIPPTFSNTCNNQKMFNQNDFDTLSRNVNTMQNSMDISNNFHKNSNYKITDKFSIRDESFHRITSDELNSLCASMNLPTQKYSRDESINTQTNFIPSCNDVNVLRNSLEKNPMFRIPNQCNTERNVSMSISNSMKESNSTQIRRGGTMKVFNTNEMDAPSENYYNKSVTASIMNMDVNTETDSLKILLEKERNSEVFSSSIEPAKIANSRPQIYHDTTAELTTSPLTLYKESNKTTLSSSVNNNENQNYAVSMENSLTRLPSDNTDVLIATMGFKTKLTYPLIINEKTTITVSNKSMSNKSNNVEKNIESCIEKNKSYVVDKSQVYPKESSILIGNQAQNEKSYENNKTLNNLNEDKMFAKEINESSIEINLFPEKCLEGLDEIQPPSFLDSDSMYEDFSGQLERLSNENRLDSILSSSNEPYILADQLKLSDNISFNDTLETSRPSEVEERLSSRNSNHSFSNTSNDILSSEQQRISPSPVNSEDKKDLVEETISPFLKLTQNLETEHTRDDCIWMIRTIKSNLITIDFISRSLVVIIRLKETETMNCIRDVEKIEFISAISAISTNVLLKIIHRLLLLKLNPEEMINKFTTYEDILPMLQYISKEVKFFMNFMFDLERLSVFNLTTMDIDRITFMVSSRKSNIILKVMLRLKLFDEINPNDIDITCVLGDVRKNDIKKLIVNIKKDHKFLSRYVNDVKEYITLMESLL